MRNIISFILDNNGFVILDTRCYYNGSLLQRKNPVIFFTADHHFGHANIIRHCSRPFHSVEEMDGALLERWNAAVGQQDTVYILGDLFFRNNSPTEKFKESGQAI